jgi:NADP-dependent 3-hydroxy acid dehydrogenase YdfG
MATERPLADTKALVTGASSGIGEATAVALGREGADVALAARRAERLETLAETIEGDHGVAATAIPTDVSDEAQVDDLVDQTVEQLGGLDAVVVNAGLGEAGPIEAFSTETYRKIMNVNVDGAFFTARAAVPHLREAAGTLVFVGSFAGQYPRPGDSVYAASKWWLRGFARCLEAEVGADGVAVTVVNPTEVRTEFGDPLKAEFDPNEVTEPDEIGDAIAFAVSQEPPNTVSELDLYRRDKFSHF